MKPQTRSVLTYLSRGRSLSALQALGSLGVYRLAARIDELRDAGYPVQTRLVKQGGRRFARYKLA